MTFENLNLMKSLLDSVRKEGYTEPTKIQQQSIPHILSGKNLFGCAQTGTGLTNTCIYGGVSQQLQVNKLNRGIDILIATPGRLLDLIQQRRKPRFQD